MFFLDNENGQLQSCRQKLTLTSGIGSDELKNLIFRLIDIPDDGNRVLKIRRYDNNLIPQSTLLNGSTNEKPFIIDVVQVHQYCPVERRQILPGYIDALRETFYSVEKRVMIAEKTLPSLNDTQRQAVENTISQLSNCVSFLDRRLDELSPPAWITQANSVV